MYDLGFPPDLQRSIANKFNNSVHAKYLVSYRPPHRVIKEYEYQVECIDQLPTSMHGSGEIHTAYFYRRTNIPRSIDFEVDNPMILPNALSGKSDETIVCDKIFQRAVELVIGDLSEYHKHVSALTSEHLNSSRPRRSNKKVSAT